MSVKPLGAAGRRWPALIAVLGLLVLTACSAGPESGTSGGVRTDVVGTEMRFEPAVISAKAGKPVTVVFRNAGTEDHDWAVVNLPVHETQATSASHAHGTGAAQVSAHVEAKPGESGEVTFVPDQPGRYTILCTYEGHKEQGMMGMLTVTGNHVASADAPGHSDGSGASHDTASAGHGDTAGASDEATSNAHGDDTGASDDANNESHADGGGHDSEAAAVSRGTKTLVLGGFAGINGVALLGAAVLRRRNPPKLPKHLQR